MAKQVKPFESPICLGYTTLLEGDDFYEVEGTVFFDSPPKKGDTAVLSDGKVWEVSRESNSNMEIVMTLKV